MRGGALRRRGTDRDASQASLKTESAGEDQRGNALPRPRGSTNLHAPRKLSQLIGERNARHHLAGLRESPLGMLAEDLLLIQNDLECARIPLDQTSLEPSLSRNFRRQTGSAWIVVSNHAIFDRDLVFHKFRILVSVSATWVGRPGPLHPQSPNIIAQVPAALPRADHKIPDWPQPRETRWRIA